MNTSAQKILVLQQGNLGESKIKGIRDHAGDLFEIKVVTIDEVLPPVIDDSSGYLPEEISADLVLDFLKHPDLSHDLALMCEQTHTPLIASGKKPDSGWGLRPPT